MFINNVECSYYYCITEHSQLFDYHKTGYSELLQSQLELRQTLTEMNEKVSSKHMYRYPASYMYMYMYMYRYPASTCT